MKKVKRFIKEFLWMDAADLDNLTLKNLEQKMIEENFEPGFIKELLLAFKIRIFKDGEREFQEWLAGLHFSCPEEYASEEKASQIYRKYQSWFEGEVEKLESETQLSWEEQTEDIEHLKNEARKAQLVIRHRLAEIIMDLM